MKQYIRQILDEKRRAVSSSLRKERPVAAYQAPPAEIPVAEIPVAESPVAEIPVVAIPLSVEEPYKPIKFGRAAKQPDAPVAESPKPFEWTRSDALALSYHQCRHCRGSGLVLRSNGFATGQTNPCKCVLRGIFRACYRKFGELASQDRFITQVSFSNLGGSVARPPHWGRKCEEYIADFQLTAKRVLTEEEYQLFRFHFLLGADWKLCTRRLGMNRGNFFHAVYRIEAKLGKVFREMEPYSLFPLDEYFFGPSRLIEVKMMPRRDVPVAAVSARFPLALRATAA